MTTPPEALLRVRSVSDLIEVIPALLGFHPVESLVLVVLDGERVRLTARVDLPPPGLADRALVPLCPVLDRFPDGTYLAVAMTPDPDLAWPALLALDDALPPATERLLVHADGALWRHDPDDPGTPYDPDGGTAQAVVAGLPVLRSREDLGRMIDPACGAGELSAALERARQSWASTSELAEAASVLLDSPPSPPALDVCTTLSLASHLDDFLDHAMLTTTRANAPARRDLWAAVARASVPGCAGAALTALGLAAWLCGQGALQSVCLERLDEETRTSVWALFLDGVIARALPPDAWDGIRAELLTSGEGSCPVG